MNIVIEQQVNDGKCTPRVFKRHTLTEAIHALIFHLFKVGTRMKMESKDTYYYELKFIIDKRK